MPILPQSQQTQPYRSENTFTGVQADTPPDNTPSNVLSGLVNMHLLREQGGQLLLQTEPGMARSFYLPPGYLIHGWAERGGVLYLLLIEVNQTTGLATGRGELGSWPSPAYAYQGPGPASELVTSGRLLPVYQALRVYYGDNDGAQPTGFNSNYFQLALDSPSELELQDSYDGTLNLIINDRGRNPALLINSGFAALAPLSDAADDYGRYQVVVREGNAQTNRYRYADFSSRLRLHPKSGTLAQALVLEVGNGGRLPGGEYRYYFCYADADDNETSIFAECGPVPVFDATTPADARGARPGEPTTRRVVFQLSALDLTYGYVRVRYVRRSGEPSATAQAYALTQRLRMSPAGTVSFAHSGYEEETGLSAEQLQAVSGSVSAFVTMCQAGNRLLLAGVRQDGVEDAALVSFARSLRLSHAQVRLPGVPGLDEGSTEAVAAGLYQPLNLDKLSGHAAGETPYTNSRAVWDQGGHLHPLNATYRRGYASGESYVFGVRFILNDYTLSDTYPLTGGDNIAGALSYEDLDPAAVFPAVFDSTGWSQALGTGSVNQTGLYRFPELSVPGMRPLVEPGSGSVNVLAARLSLPSLPGGQPAGIPASIRARAVGVQFMRAARTPNRLVQGYALPTLRSAVTPPNNDVFDQHHGDFRSVLRGETGNLKVLPTLSGIVETCWKRYGGRDEKGGVLPFRFNKNTHVNGTNYPLHDPLRMALYAPDALLRPATYLARLNLQDVLVRSVATVFCKRAVVYDNNNGELGTSWSLYKTTGQQRQFDPFYGTVSNAGTAFWTLDKQFTVNAGKFGSAEKFLLGKTSNGDRYLLNLAWGPYVGLRFKTAELDATGLIGGGNAFNTGYEMWSGTPKVSEAPTASAYLVNVYNNGGLLTLDALKGLYPSQGLSFVPISERLSWSQLEGQADASNSLLLYGGDTYVAPTYYRMNRQLLPGERKETKFDAPVGQVLSLVCETGAHPAARSEESSGTGENSMNSYVPRIGANTSKFDAYRQAEHVSQAESTRYNGGYASESAGSPALVQSVARVEGVPFRARQFQVRVWASEPGVDGNFNNGYRLLPALGFRDYERSLGPIVRLVPAGDQQVLVVHTHGLELLGLSERVLTGQGTAGPVYAQGLDFLPPQGKILSRELGCQHPLGVCVSPAGVYGLDAALGVGWFWAFGTVVVKRLSDFSISRALRPALAAYKAGTVELGTRDVRATYDSQRGDVILSLYTRNAKPDAQGDYFSATHNFVYSEPLQQWLGEHNYYRAQALLDVPLRGLFSLPLAGQALTQAGALSVWQHRALPAAGAAAQRAGGYGVPHEASCEFIVLGSGVDSTKVLDNLVLVSSGRDADQLDVFTTEQPQGLRQLLIGAPADITRRSAQRREGHTWVSVRGAAKRRGRWIRVRLSWLAAPDEALRPNATPGTLPQDAGGLLKVTSVVRDSYV